MSQLLPPCKNNKLIDRLDDPGVQERQLFLQFVAHHTEQGREDLAERPIVLVLYDLVHNFVKEDSHCVLGTT